MTWKKLGEKLVLSHRSSKIYLDHVKTDGGEDLDYFVLRKKPCAIVIPKDGDKIILVGQYRYPVDRFSWEFPSGHFSGSSIEETAINELKEETGITAKNIKKIGVFHPAPGHLDQECHVFVATGLIYGKPKHDATEYGMKMKRVTKNELEKMISKGAITDGLTISALFMNSLVK